MKINGVFLSYFKNLDDQIFNLFKIKEQQTLILLKKFKDETTNRVVDVIDKEYKNNYINNFNSFLARYLDNSFLEIIKKTYKNVLNLSITTREIVLYVSSNYMFSSNVCNHLMTSYKKRMNEINSINESFLKRFDEYFYLFLYNMSINYNYHEDSMEYKIISKIILQNKKILLDNMKLICKNSKEEVFNLFKEDLDNFLEDSNKIKNDIYEKNISMVMFYAKDLLTNKIILNVNDKLITSCGAIKKMLGEGHNIIVKYEKGKNTPDKQFYLQNLYNEIVSFNNILYTKSLNCLKEMSEVFNLDKKEMSEEVKKYNDMIYQICKFEYNFDRQFFTYKKEMLNKQFFLKEKNLEAIENVLHKMEDKVISVEKLSVIALFKESLEDINNVYYKTMIAKYKVSEIYDLLDTKDIEKLFK